MSRACCVLAAAALLLAIDSGGVRAGPPSPQAPPPVVGKLEPLPRRAEPNPMQAARVLTAAQERIAHGDEDALINQAALAREVSRRLAAFSSETWSDQRNREALIKHVLSGGDARLLRQLFDAGVFGKTRDGQAEASGKDDKAHAIAQELALARGTLAYAYGDRSGAATALTALDPRALPASLGGHVALVQALLAGDTDHKRAIALCNEARLLSPGTLIEEAALRLTIELAIATADRRRFEIAVARYLRRFPRSLHARSVDVRIARVLAALDRGGAADGRNWLRAVIGGLPTERRARLLAELAAASLRAGKLATAAAAAEMLGADGASDAAGGVVLAYGGAALATGPDRRRALRMLEEAERGASDEETRALIAAARALAALIDAPPSRLAGGHADASSGAPASPAIEARVKAVRARLDGADRLLTEAGQ